MVSKSTGAMAPVTPVLTPPLAWFFHSFMIHSMSSGLVSLVVSPSQTVTVGMMVRLGVLAAVDMVVAVQHDLDLLYLTNEEKVL